MWKKDRNIVLLTVGLLALVLLFCLGSGRFLNGPTRAAQAWLREFISGTAEEEDGGGKSTSAKAVVKTARSSRDSGDSQYADAGESGGDAPEKKASAYSKGKIALTFDDGPHPTYTPQLLDGLAKRNVRASFFITGKNAEKYPELVRRLDEEGHLIGNHTYSHMQLSKKNGEAFKEELIKTNDIISEITGKEVVYVRPPYGSWDKKFESELNMFPVLWNIDPLDWSSKDSAGIMKKVISKAKENSIILMHDEYPSTVTAALAIVDDLKRQGYEIVTVDEILFD